MACLGAQAARRHRTKTAATPLPRVFKKPRLHKPEATPSAIPSLMAQEKLRRRRSTINRVITPLKAMLNHALSRRKVTSDEAWSMIGKFKRVNASGLRWLTEEEATRLLNACAADLRAFAGGGLVSGCGPGELARAEVRDFDPQHRDWLARLRDLWSKAINNHYGALDRSEVEVMPASTAVRNIGANKQDVRSFGELVSEETA